MNENPIPNQNSNPTPVPTPTLDSNQPASPVIATPSNQPNPAANTNDFNGMPGTFQPINTVPNNTKWWRTTVGMVGIAVVMLLAVGLAIFGLISLTGSPNYGESYQLSNKLYDQLEGMVGSRKSSCAAMINEESDYDVDSSTYKGYVEECRKSISEVRDTVGKLGQSSGIKRDEKLKEQYEAFEKAVNAALPDKSNIDKMAKIYTAVHEFAIRLNDIDSNSSESDVRSAAALLTSSGSKDWAEYGQTWETKMLAYISAYKAYNNASYSSSQYSELRQAYMDARDDIQQHLRSIDAEGWDNGGLNVDAMDDLEDTFNDLKSSIRKTYESHYDGKNEKDCVDLGDGEASCD